MTSTSKQDGENISKDVSHIPKFNGKNYPSWKYGVWLLFRQHELTDIVENKVSKPEEVSSILLHSQFKTSILNGFSSLQVKDESGVVTNEAAITAWNRKDILASGFLYATVNEEMKDTLINCETASAMWKRLSDQYMQNAADNKHLLKQQFFQLQFRCDQDVMQHITAIESLAKQLKDLGEPVPEIDVVNKIICTLPPSFRNFMSVWDSLQEEEKTVSLLTTRLLKEERTNKRFNNGRNSPADEAFFTSIPQTSMYRQGPQHLRGSYHVHRGHRGFRGGWRGPPETKRRRLECHYCQKEGHFIAACRSRIRDEKQALSAHGGSHAQVAEIAKGEHGTDFSLQILSDHSSLSFSVRSNLDFFADSGATSHMSDQLDFFDTFEAIDTGTWMVSGVGGVSLPVCGQGNIRIETTVNGITRSGTIKDVLYVPLLGTNLFSIGTATENGTEIHFNNNQVYFSHQGTTFMVGQRAGRGLYHLNIKVVTKERVMLGKLNSCKSFTDYIFFCFCLATFTVQKTIEPLSLWHERLGHLSYKTIQQMSTEGAVNGLHLGESSDVQSSPCADCMKGKMCRLPFPTGRDRATEIGQLIHSDVCGPMQIASPGGARYYVIFKDDYSGWTVINFIQRKSEVEEKFMKYAARMRVEQGKSINTLRTDRGGEYVGKNFNSWLDREGIRHETTTAYSPQQNGVSERYNRTAMEATRCLLFARKVYIYIYI